MYNWVDGCCRSGRNVPSFQQSGTVQGVSNTSSTGLSDDGLVRLYRHNNNFRIYRTLTKAVELRLWKRMGSKRG